MNDRFAALRALLLRQPTEHHWGQLCKLFEEWPDDGQREMALQYAQAHLDQHWPMKLRKMKWTALHNWNLFPISIPANEGSEWLISGKNVPVAWPLARHLELIRVELDRATLQELIQADVFSHFHSLQCTLVTFHDGCSDLLFTSNALREVRRMVLNNELFNDREMIALSESQSLSKLTFLDLQNGSSGKQGWLSMFCAPGLPALTELSARRINLAQEDFEEAMSYAPGSRFSKLRLGVSSGRWEGHHIEALTNSPLLEGLSSFTIQHQEIAGGWGESFANVSSFQGLTSLSLPGCNLWDRDTCAFFASPHLEKLQHLHIGGNEHLRDDTFIALTQSSAAQGLLSLNATQCAIRTPAMEALANCKGLAQLKELHMSRSTGPKVFQMLCQSPYIQGLEKLHMGNSGLRDEDAQALIQAPFIKKLKSLVIPQHQLSDVQLEALYQSLPIENMEQLTIHSKNAGKAWVRLWADCPLMTKTTSLSYSDFGLTSEDIRHLVTSPYAENINYIHLYKNPIGDAGAQAIATSPYLYNLTDLEIDNCDIGDMGGTALANSTTLQCLEAVFMSGNPLGDDVAIAFANSSHHKALDSLLLMDSEITDEGAKAIAHSPLLRWVSCIALSNNKLTDEGMLAFVDNPNLSRRLVELALDGNEFSVETYDRLRNDPFLSTVEILELGERSDCHDYDYEDDEDW